jgi:dipeptidase D
MSDALAGLEPRTVWRHFADIARIPRPSGHEERAASYVRSVASEHGLTVRDDAIGNLVVQVPASAGRERAPAVILQGHLDMVCEKNKGVEHDFMKDPIRARVEDGWVVATGTTLGSDNGVGVAAALASATDPEVAHGPLELLFTLDEETGLTGAQKLDPSILHGRTLLNLDSEEDGVLFVGCAGGADIHLHLEVQRGAPRAGSRAFVLEVTGLRGGHSGLNIHENRGNAVKILARTLYAALDAGVPFQLHSLHGGSKHNAIPRDAEAVLWLAGGGEARLEPVLAAMREAVRVELQGIDEGVEIRLAAGKAEGPALSDADRDRLLRLLVALPHGVLGMSPAIPGLVETSNNVAVVAPDDGRIRVVTSSRSSVMPTQQAVLAAIRAAGEMAGAEVETRDGYPGWKPDLTSPVLGVVRGVYRELWGRDPKVTAIHAGLECGLLGEKIPGLDMVSFGPQIEGAHSPDERVEIASVERFWNALKITLDRLSAS